MRNSSLVERSCAENERASSSIPKLWTLRSGRGAFQLRRRSSASLGGAAGKENVGMSNEKMGEIPIRRKTKGSSFDVNQNRVSRVLRSSREANLMAIW